MAHLGRIEVVISDPATGLPVTGATVEIRKQGGTVQGTTGPTTIDLHAIGAMAAFDTVNIDNDADSPVAVLTIPSGTQITVVGPGLAPLINDVTRVTVALPLPSIFNAEDGGESKANPLTTDANGLAFAYAPVGFYDAFVTRGAVTFLLTNVLAVGGTSFLSNVFGTGTADAYIFDTFRALASGDNIASFRDNGVEKAFIDKDGKVSGTSAEYSGLMEALNGLEVTGQLKLLTSSSQIVPGFTSFSIRNNADDRDNFFMNDAGQITLQGDVILGDGGITADIHIRQIRANKGTALTTGNIVLGANWGTGPAVTSVVNAKSTAGRVRITSGSGPTGNPSFTIQFPDNFTSTPHCIVQRAGGTISGNIGMVALLTPTSTDCVVTVVGNVAASTAYDFEWLVMESL